MKQIHRTLSICLCLFFSTTLQAQVYDLAPVGVGLSGGQLESANHQLRHSIGEPLTDTWSISAAELRQGFQQSAQSFVTSLTSQESLQDLRTYPQPAREQLTLDWTGSSPLIMRLSWWDISGRVVENQPSQVIYLLPGEKIVLSLQHLVPGTYLLLAKDENDSRLGAWPVIKLP